MEILIAAAHECADAGHGQRGAVVERAARVLNLSPQRTHTLVAKTARSLGLADPRKKRADAGASAISDADLDAIAGARWKDMRNGKHMIALEETINMLHQAGKISARLTERFALRFKNSMEFECIGEHVGNIGVGNINTDFAPINPISGAPYFVLRAIGWGSGWAAGNVQFLHFVGSIYAYAAIRTVQPSTAIALDHHFELLTRINVDRLPANH